MTDKYWRRPRPKRAHMIFAWAIVCITRGVFYTPIHPGYGDFPPALRALITVDLIWLFGVLWLIAGALGVLTIRWSRFERFFWPTLFCMMFGWAGMYFGGAFTGVSSGTWLAGFLYLAVGYGMWASKGDPDASDQHRKRVRMWCHKRASAGRPDAEAAPGGSD